MLKYTTYFPVPLNTDCGLSDMKMCKIPGVVKKYVVKQT